MRLQKLGHTAKALFTCEGSICVPNTKWVEKDGGERERERESDQSPTLVSAL